MVEIVDSPVIDEEAEIRERKQHLNEEEQDKIIEEFNDSANFWDKLLRGAFFAVSVIFTTIFFMLAYVSHVNYLPSHPLSRFSHLLNSGTAACIAYRVLIGKREYDKENLLVIDKKGKNILYISITMAILSFFCWFLGMWFDYRPDMDSFELKFQATYSLLALFLFCAVEYSLMLLSSTKISILELNTYKYKHKTV
mmetsp:Transcript_8767/g.12987  ORF Transcript_8767/g.12987 Transcript_8767/m.12987 type:complete len:196 (-) Transcript_8767:1848-2435(-)